MSLQFFGVAVVISFWSENNPTERFKQWDKTGTLPPAVQVGWPQEATASNKTSTTKPMSHNMLRMGLSGKFSLAWNRRRNKS